MEYEIDVFKKKLEPLEFHKKYPTATFDDYDTYVRQYAEECKKKALNDNKKTFNALNRLSENYEGKIFFKRYCLSCSKEFYEIKKKISNVENTAIAFETVSFSCHNFNDSFNMELKNESSPYFNTVKRLDTHFYNWREATRDEINLYKRLVGKYKVFKEELKEIH